MEKDKRRKVHERVIRKDRKVKGNEWKKHIKTKEKQKMGIKSRGNK